MQCFPPLPSHACSVAALLLPLPPVEGGMFMFPPPPSLCAENNAFLFSFPFPFSYIDGPLQEQETGMGFLPV